MSAGGVQFSRDPLNLKNKYSRKYEGSINDKAIGVQPSENGGVTLLTKKANKSNKPASAYQSTTFGPSTSTRKTYRAIANSTAKRSCRADLRADAIARASAIRKSQKPVKEDRPVKLRGVKAKKAAEA
ncbi:ribosomal protein L28e [Lepidopterella palustris CBS 459.81]|uniref:Ribosomal protein L28e n=1 Tax=Lepidopterella palustris CBS 459.81 TaxID=1314670 RepID=A0A8E2EIR6_9PEZI|nr:ribosomal protein L28e [Lepidopterella palustris CBS 459.81]